MNKIKVASVQIDPKFGEIQKNIKCVLNLIEKAAQQGAKLIVFPECSLTGLGADSLEETKKISLPRNGLWINQFIELVNQYDIYVAIGLIESVNDKIFNSLYLFGEGKILQIYSKAHLTNLGADRFVEKGTTPFIPVDTKIGKLGLMICYDSRFPEQARVLSLQGSQVLIHSTNLPITASDHVDLLLPTRANENRVYLISAGRVGVEKGFHFLGRSTIYDLNGSILAQADNQTETIIYQTIDLSLAKEKDVVFPPTPEKPFKQVNSLFSSRRPELYGEIVKSSNQNVMQ
ncbi:carbon-nitrogen hydrolase family protein [Peribacillus asahii]|uniref:carbon-nitrogen hydrolase family protein n=1 Tax=Peribacillus asahii TaxID=228899 RepID=UPI003810CA25